MVEKNNVDREQKIQALNAKLLIIDSLSKDENAILASKVLDGIDKLRLKESLENEIQVEAKSLEEKQK